MEHQPPIKVLFVTASAAAGGGPRHLLDWLEALRGAGSQAGIGACTASAAGSGDLEIYVAAPDDGLFAEPLRQMAITSTPLPEKAISIPAVWRLLRFARKHDIDLVHSFGRAGGFYGRALGLFGFPVLHTPQGVISRPSSQFIYDRFENIGRRWTVKYIFGSESEAKEAHQRFGAVGGVVVPPIVSAPTIEIGDRCGNALLERRPITVGTVGRFVEHKRMVTMARAIIAMGSRFRLRLYGEGEDERELEKLARVSEGRIEILGVLDRWKALEEIDIFASWSKSESFGLAAAEAMAVGLPCVLSDVPGHRDLAGASGERAWLFNPKSKSDFVRALAEVLANKTKRLQKIEIAEAAIKEACGPEKIASDLRRVYREIHLGG